MEAVVSAKSRKEMNADLEIVAAQGDSTAAKLDVRERQISLRDLISVSQG